ncbi:methylated-DNA--[protein]-cysteine S-methyltransferase [Alteromonas facilis]|uniref:methylated-DNA--[protein]-cysteine S-methyltransferase n=1 Tax=Alteromonas facilis TaxID=2048004 RepID=UPI000C284CCB|nr:methylated-DNA--[protein]-cysteine S-methyltransferase [Alteromonas facilis]
MPSVEYLHTAIGWIEICATNEAVCSILFVDEAGVDNPNAVTKLAHQQLSEYFAHERTAFNLPLASSGTAFQAKVWQNLQSVEYGHTASYLTIANAIGNPKACRAVGAANGKNPISIVVPCHRIIGRNKKLVGYAGGLSRKQWLLEWEASLKRN